MQRERQREVVNEEGKWLRKKETGTLPVSNQRSCGAEFKAEMGQTSKLLEFCHLSSSAHFLQKKKKKRRERREEKRGRKEVNENQTHGPVWSGWKQRGG